MIAGNFLEDSMSRPILIGERLSQSLGARLDDKIVLMVQAADGSMGAQLFRVAGIFRSGSPDLTAAWCTCSGRTRSRCSPWTAG